MLKKFRQSKLVDDVFYGLRPASAALIAAAGVSVLTVAVMLVVLGAEVLWGANHGRPFRLGSAVCCLCVMGLCAALNLAYACYAAALLQL